jgi:hypothetical protein
VAPSALQGTSQANALCVRRQEGYSAWIVFPWRGGTPPRPSHLKSF